MTAPLTDLPTFDRARSLTSLEVSEVPRESGYYIAWITDEAALDEAGLDGPAPRVAYVGKAQGGLYSRLRKHIAGGLPGLSDILFARGKILPPFGHWNLPADRGRMWEPTPLTQISDRQLRNWQHRHLRWGWATCGRAEAARRERAAIAALDPLFNTQFSTGPLVQLRASAVAPRARARWLWHASWAGYLLEHEFRSVRVEGVWSYALPGPDGYPVPAEEDAGDGAIVDCFPANMSVSALREVMHAAARGLDDVEIRDAVGRTRRREELEAWWAAHAGAEELPNATTVEQAMRDSLSLRSETDAAGPAELPSGDRLEELLPLVKSLHGVDD